MLFYLRVFLELEKVIASSGFADTTRIGAGNPELGKSMMEGVFGNFLKNKSKEHPAVRHLKES